MKEGTAPDDGRMGLDESALKGATTMTVDRNILEKIDVLYDVGRDFVERPQLHGASVPSMFDPCEFDQWRRLVNDLLFMIGGCDDLYYQRFSTEVTRPHVRDLEQGLRILSAVRDDVVCEVSSPRTGTSLARSDCGRARASYH
ncbi:MAG: hypothetical protein AB1646_14990 [Thermodesulfobacteriota bacterium]